MRSLRFLALLSGCLCGGYAGAGDRVYTQGTAQIILCANHGFFAMLADGSTIEGTYAESSGSAATTTGTATAGATATLAFDYTITSGMLDAPLLDDNVWTQQSLNKTDLDHADVHCTDLTMRPWWPTTAAQ